MVFMFRGIPHTRERAQYKMKLVDIASAPEGSADNDMIVSGHRPALTISQCLNSMFHIHNQTVNIWTSVFSVVLNLILMQKLATNVPNANFRQTAFVYVHGVGRSVCWVLSWAYHTFCCHSPAYSRQLAKLDYIGCVLSTACISSDFMSAELDEGRFFWTCWTAANVYLFSTLHGILRTADEGETSRFRRFQLFMKGPIPFILPVFIRNGLQKRHLYLLTTLLVEVLGGAIYTTKIPESVWRSNHIDVFFSSHILWHYLNIVFDTLTYATCSVSLSRT